MKLKQSSVTIMLIFVLLLAGCGSVSSNEDELSVVKTHFIMGTVVTVKVYGPNREKAAGEVMEELQRLEGLMSINLEDSEITRINNNAEIEPVKVSEDTFKVVKTAYWFAEKTDGLFDPSIGPLVKLWGIGTKNARVPLKEEILEVLPLIDYKNIILDEKEKTIFLTKPGMIIDIGGIAKGYAADCGVEIFKKHQIKYGYINIGGNVIVHGSKPDKSLWRIGVQDPRNERGEFMGVIVISNRALVTSGDYERYFIENGVRYHHILNPKTGYPVKAGLISASVLGENSMECDALSTSIFLMGAEKGMKLAQECGYEVVLITEDKKLIFSQDIAKTFEIVNGEYKP